MDIEKVKDKIKKLMTLSADSTYDGETHAAFQKAQELMAMYKISQMDLKDEVKKEECIRKKTVLGYGTRSSDHYMNDLAEVIANNFCCINYLSTPRGTRTHYVAFMGYKDDVDICCEVLYAANNAIIRGYNRVYKEMQKEYSMDYIPAKYFNPAKVGYIEGYIAGLKVALESQKEKHQEWGLVLVVPQEAKDFLGGLQSVNYDTPIYVDNSFYNEGYNDGKNFHLNEKLPSTKDQERLAE